jgi:hypothetical protein
MSRETTTTVIAGTPYIITQIGAKAARRIELRCARLLVGGLKIDDIRGGESGAIEALLTAVASGLSDEDLDMVCDVFAQATQVSLPLQVTTGTLASPPVSLAAVFDDHFAGANHVNMWRWLIFCFKFNFASFLGELGTLFPNAQANAFEPQKAQTPQSGASSSQTSSPSASAR